MPHKDPAVATAYWKARYARDPEGQKAAARQWRLNNLARARANSKKWSANNREKRMQIARDSAARTLKNRTAEGRAAHNALRRFRRTGITREQYEQWSLDQKGKCAICKTVPDKPLRGDHCHKSGKPRGLLCFKCNYGLGMFNDNIEALQGAIEYLQRTR